MHMPKTFKGGYLNLFYSRMYKLSRLADCVKTFFLEKVAKLGYFLWQKNVQYSYLQANIETYAEVMNCSFFDLGVIHKIWGISDHNHLIQIDLNRLLEFPRASFLNSNDFRK